jgi:site-specific DNA-adenine methylase
MFRYPGSKWHESPHIVSYVSQMIEHLFIPFLGSGAVWRRLMSQGRQFASVHLNDLDQSVVRFWASVLDGSHTRELRRVRSVLCPEKEHEHDIQDEFEQSKVRWLQDGDPFAWYFLRLYAVGQFVFAPCDRANVASFDRMYLGYGLDRETPEKWEQIRSWLARPGVTLTNRDGLDIVAELAESAGPTTLAYLDPSYPIADKRHRFYPQELTIRQHHELCELLKAARFRWILSMPFSLLVRDIYLQGTGFNRVLLPTPHAGHLGRSTTKPRHHEWIIMNFS